MKLFSEKLLGPKRAQGRYIRYEHLKELHHNAGVFFH